MTVAHLVTRHAHATPWLNKYPSECLVCRRQGVKNYDFTTYYHGGNQASPGVFEDCTTRFDAHEQGLFAVYTTRDVAVAPWRFQDVESYESV